MQGGVAGAGVDHGKPRFSPRIPVAPGRRSRRPASRGTGNSLYVVLPPAARVPACTPPFFP
jgi:hypothetical protein